jgi:hypothetical protein
MCILRLFVLIRLHFNVSFTLSFLEPGNGSRFNLTVLGLTRVGGWCFVEWYVLCLY